MNKRIQSGDRVKQRATSCAFSSALERPKECCFAARKCNPAANALKGTLTTTLEIDRYR